MATRVQVRATVAVGGEGGNPTLRVPAQASLQVITRLCTRSWMPVLTTEEGGAQHGFRSRLSRSKARMRPGLGQISGPSQSCSEIEVQDGGFHLEPQPRRCQPGQEMFEITIVGSAIERMGDTVKNCLVHVIYLALPKMPWRRLSGRGWSWNRRRPWHNSKIRNSRRAQDEGL